MILFFQKSTILNKNKYRTVLIMMALLLFINACAVPSFDRNLLTEETTAEDSEAEPEVTASSDITEDQTRSVVPEPTDSESDHFPEPSPSPSPTVSPETESNDDDDPDNKENDLDPEITKMLPVFDSFIRALDNASSKESLSEDDVFIMYTLYYVSANWGYLYEGVEFDEGIITIPRNILEDLTLVLSGNKEIPEIPDCLSSSMKLENDLYSLKSSDTGNRYFELYSSKKHKDSTVSVTVFECNESDEIIKTFVFDLEPETESTLFAYRIKGYHE